MEESENLEQTTSETKEIPDFVVPDKFVDKSTESVITSYQSLEKSYSKQGQELGTLRKQVDGLIAQNLSSIKTEEKQEPVEFDFDDPSAYVNQAVESNQILKSLQDEVKSLKAVASEAQVKELHPEFMETVNSAEFNDFVMSDPILQEVYHTAANSGSAEHLSYILDAFNKHQGTSLSKQNSKALKAAKSGSGTGGSTGGKTYKEAEIVELAINNPAKYELIKSDISKAYKEGRVHF